MVDGRYNQNDFSSAAEWQEGYFRVPGSPLLSVERVEERYALENELLNAVARANEEKALEAFAGLQAQDIPPRMEDRLRDYKDYCVALTTLLRKPAEQAGVHPIHIDNLSNRHIQMIEQLQNPADCRAFSRRMVGDYCQLIREQSRLRTYSPVVQKAITYVTSDLRAPLGLRFLAARLSVNESYLSTRFRKEVGMPLTEYVNRRRIEQAKKLLLQTDMPVKMVGLQCGVPDVYYFSRMFKRLVGLTPKSFRESGGRS